jgi:putative heme iron utilization protein
MSMRKSYCSSPFKVVEFGTKIGYFNLQKAQNLSGGFKMVALKQRVFVGHLERASPIVFMEVIGY